MEVLEILLNSVILFHDFLDALAFKRLNLKREVFDMIKCAKEHFDFLLFEFILLLRIHYIIDENELITLKVELIEFFKLLSHLMLELLFVRFLVIFS